MRHQVSDGESSCTSVKAPNDNSDEETILDCFEGEFRCPSGRCIPREWVGDGHQDCESIVDMDTKITYNDETQNDIICLHSEFKCHNKSVC